MMITNSKAERGSLEARRATLLGKDMVSAFRSVRKEGRHNILRKEGQENVLPFCSRFREPRTFRMTWGNADWGKAHMGGGSPQGSPLYPVFGLLYIARTLNSVENRIRVAVSTGLRRHKAKGLHVTPQRRQSQWTPSAIQTMRTHYSSPHTTAKEHGEVIRIIDKILEDSAAENHLVWDASKESRVTPGSRDPIQSNTTLGIHINSRPSHQHPYQVERDE